MKKLKARYGSLKKATASTRGAIDHLHSVNKDLVEYQLSGKKEEISFKLRDAFIAARDSLVQRFKYTTDLLWKYLKDYLEIKLGDTLKVGGPKNIVREAVRVKIISEDGAETLFDMIDSRNLTSHIYREEVAEGIANIIPEYVALMEKIVKTLTP